MTEDQALQIISNQTELLTKLTETGDFLSLVSGIIIALLCCVIFWNMVKGVV